MSGCPRLDQRRAWLLRKQGFTNKEIGKMLAAEYGRRMPFTEDAVSKAVSEYPWDEPHEKVEPE